MKLPKLKKNQLIIIEFLDLEEDPDWMSEEKAKKPPDCDGIGAGFYLCHDKNWLIVSSQILGREKPQRNKMSYPIGCIKRIKKVHLQ